MFIIAIALLFIFLWCFAMFFQHMKDLSDWNKRPEEEKEKSIPSVAASESGTAQTTGVSPVGL